MAGDTTGFGNGDGNRNGDGALGTRGAWLLLLALWVGLPLFILAYKAGLDFLLGRPVAAGIARMSGARFLLAVTTVNLLLTAAFAAFYWRDLLAFEAWRAWLLAPPPRPGPLPPFRLLVYPLATALLFRPVLALARRLSPARGHLYGAPAAMLLIVALAEFTRKMLRARPGR